MKNIQREDYVDLLKISIGDALDPQHFDEVIYDAKRLAGFELLNLSKKTKKLAKRLLN